MASKNVSIGGLVNLKELNALIKKADVLICGVDSDMVYICNSHWLVRVRLAQDSTTRAEIFKRLGRWPEDGGALECRGTAEGKEYGLEYLKNSVAATFYADCHDTRMSQDIGDGRELRIFHCDDQGQRCYIALERKYFNLINTYERAAAQTAKKSQPILFTGSYDEFAFILPVNYSELPYMATI